VDCPNCHTYNPEDRTVCWRCDKPLPRPEPPKRKRQTTSRQWLYILLAIVLIFSLLQFCGSPRSSSPQSGLSGSAPQAQALSGSGSSL
jgi:hypothetical protein